jgi:hypothetical protein
VSTGVCKGGPLAHPPSLKLRRPGARGSDTHFFCIGGKPGNEAEIGGFARVFEDFEETSAALVIRRIWPHAKLAKAAKNGPSFVPHCGTTDAASEDDSPSRRRLRLIKSGVPGICD